MFIPEGSVKPVIADLSPDLVTGEGGLVLNRINTPIQYRGKGYASALLRQILEDAQAEGITITLGVSGSGGLTDAQLFAWYGRYGFERLRKKQKPDQCGMSSLMVWRPREKETS